MKIVFWAPVHGQTGQSSNVLAIALMLALRKKSHLLITQTQFQMNDLEDAVVGRTVTKGMRDRFYQGMGIDAVNRCIKHKKMEKEDLNNCCVQILPDGDLMLLPGTRSGNYEIHFEVLQDSLFLFRQAEIYFDAILIDANPGGDGISRMLMEEADVVVVCLSQNMGVLDLLFRNYPKVLERKRVFYLLGAYLSDSCYNLHNLRFRYSKIKRENSGVVPVNVRFRDAVSCGKTVDFFESNLECEQGDSNYEFIREIKEVSERLLRFAGMV